MTFNFKTTFSTSYFNIEEGFDVNKPGSSPYYRMTGSDSVICCAMTMEGEFVMVRQYRPSINEYSLEFPAGGLLKKEKPIEKAMLNEEPVVEENELNESASTNEDM